jgi:hypothetical protein
MLPPAGGTQFAGARRLPPTAWQNAGRCAIVANRAEIAETGHE